MDLTTTRILFQTKWNSMWEYYVVSSSFLFATLTVNCTHLYSAVKTELSLRLSDDFIFTEKQKIYLASFVGH